VGDFVLIHVLMAEIFKLCPVLRVNISLITWESVWTIVFQIY